MLIRFVEAYIEIIKLHLYGSTEKLIESSIIAKICTKNCHSGKSIQEILSKYKIYYAVKIFGTRLQCDT